MLFASPDSFDAGKLRFLQNTINLDFSRPLELFEKANISFGLEQRHEAYSTVAGEELSYATYDIHGGVLPLGAPSSQKTTDFFGNALPGGAQVLPGFRKESALTKTRNVVAGNSKQILPNGCWLMLQCVMNIIQTLEIPLIISSLHV